MERNPVVLIVEDNERQAEMIANIVKKTGFCTPIVASNGIEAFKVLDQHPRWFIDNPIGCILLDWNMPGMSGEQFIKKLRQQESINIFKKNIPIVIITAHKDPERVECATDPKYGRASWYLVKPFQKTELVTLLEMILVDGQAKPMMERLIQTKDEVYLS